MKPQNTIARTPLTRKIRARQGDGIGESPARGRPTDFKPEYVELGRNYCLLGADDKDLAQMFEVDERTINRWKDSHPEFCQSIKEGKDIADAEIAKALYQRAKGYAHDEVHVSNYQGQITLTELVKKYPPDTAAASLWLRNRQPAKWRDKVDINHGVQPGSSMDALFRIITESAASRIRPAENSALLPSEKGG